MKKIFETTLIIQTGYILITAVWPLVDIASFMAVTGPKTDVWLVKTVGALLIPISLCLGSFLWIKTNRIPAYILGSTTAAAFILIDLYYALSGTISDIYLLDAAVEFVFLAAWMYIIMTTYHPGR